MVYKTTQIIESYLNCAYNKTAIIKMELSVKINESICHFGFKMKDFKTSLTQFVMRNQNLGQVSHLVFIFLSSLYGFGQNIWNKS